jgi:hypothetical protein
LSEDPADPEFVREAVAFYVRLPLAARRSLRAMVVLGAESDIDAAIHDAGLAIVRRGFDVARRRGRPAAANLAVKEMDIEAVAVRLQREAEGREPL